MFYLILTAVTATALAYNLDLPERIAPDFQKDRMVHQHYIPKTGEGEMALRTIWEEPTWNPTLWDQDVYHTQAVLARFVNSGIVYNSYFKDGKMPVVKVGPAFYELSRQDQTNVLSYINKAYNVTARGGIIEVKDWKTKKAIGTYTTNGFFPY